MSDPVKKIKVKPGDIVPKGPPPMTLPPNTTEQEDMVTAGQRKINLIWEYTQCFIAVFATIVVFILGTILSVQGRIEDFPPFMALSYGLIVGFYFQRTNHSKIGGTGPKTGTR